MAKILVTGATGFVARNLRAALVRGGHRVTSVSRGRPEPLDGETVVSVSGYDDPDMLRAARGCRAAVHLAGSGRQTVEGTYADANHAPAAAVARICKELGIPRMAYLSGLGVSPHATSGYFISKYMAERAVSEVPEPVILRPSYIIGPDDHLTAGLNRQVQGGTITIPGSGDYMMQPIAIRDVVRILEMAATAPRMAGRTLDLVGPQTLTFAEYVSAFAGARAGIKHADMETAYRDAVLGRNPVYELDDLNIMVAGYVGDHAELREATGMEFCGVPKMLQACGVP